MSKGMQKKLRCSRPPKWSLIQLSCRSSNFLDTEKMPVQPIVLDAEARMINAPRIANQMAVVRGRMGSLRCQNQFQEQMRRWEKGLAQRCLDTLVTATRLRAAMRRRRFVLLSALLLVCSATPSGAINPETICFAGSGKPKTDIVMCTMALLQAPPLSRATLLTRRARSRIQIEDDARALDDLAQSLAINPLSAEALTQKGRALGFLGRAIEAREALNEALRLSPNDNRARRIRGVLALTLGQYAGAITDLSRVIAAGSGEGESHALRGIAHYLAEDVVAALRDFREASARDSSYAYLPLWIALAQQRIGQTNKPELQQARAALLGDQDWPAPVIALFQVPGPEALAAALDLAARGAPQLRRARIGQIHFLHGELLRLRDAPQKARVAFVAAVRDGDPRTVEYALAKQRLSVQQPRGRFGKN